VDRSATIPQIPLRSLEKKFGAFFISAVRLAFQTTGLGWPLKAWPDQRAAKADRR